MREYDWDAPRGPNAHRDARVHFVRNAWEPIAVPRWALNIKYMLFVVAGIAAFIVGSPTLSLVTFTGYEPIWAAFVAFGGVLGFIGAFKAAWGYIEAIGGSVIVSFLAVLIVSLIFRDAFVVAFLLINLCVVPTVRSVFLISHYSFKKRGLI
jgi:hypothetical protein